MKRVVFLIENLGTGGAQRHTVGVVSALQGQFDFRIVIFAREGELAGFVTPDVADRIVVLNERRLWNPLKWVPIGRAIAALEPDVLISVNQVVTFLASALRMLRILRCAHVVVFHSTQVGSLSGWIRTIPFFPAVWASNCLIFISANQSRIWKWRGLVTRRIELIRNGIDLTGLTVPTSDEKRQAKVDVGLAPDDYVVGILAAFRWEKNHRQLVEALCAMKGAAVRPKLLLVGDGPTRPEMEALVIKLGVADQVVFAGLQSDVRPFIRAMDAGVLPSIAVETLSLSALECMAMGVPMIMSNIGGASEIVRDGENGLLFEPRNTAELIAAFVRCHDESFRAALGLQARSDVVANFNEKEMNTRYAGVFGSLAKSDGDGKA